MRQPGYLLLLLRAQADPERRKPPPFFGNFTVEFSLDRVLLKHVPWVRSLLQVRAPWGHGGLLHMGSWFHSGRIREQGPIL